MSRLVLVLGMHRSGTSLIAKAMTCLGAELGDAEWYGPDNPTGFWEHQGVHAVNEKILEIMGDSWDRPPDPARVLRQTMESPDLIYLRGMAEHLLRHELARFPLLAVKDPRLCVLMPFWRPVLYGLGDISVVRVIRHPNAVAGSLLRRNQMDRERALSLWLRYTLGWSDGATRWPTVVVDYDAMMAEPISQIARIGQRLGLPVDKTKAVQFATDFVRDDLWHEPEEAALPVEASILWQQLRQQATQP